MSPGLGSWNVSGRDDTRCSRSSRGKPKPIRVSSRLKATNTRLPTRNLMRSRTSTSYALGSSRATRRTSSTVIMPRTYASARTDRRVLPQPPDRMTGVTPPEDRRTSWSDAAPIPFWLDTPDRPPARAALDGDVHTDLAVVGGGFTGLWTALMAKERDPGRDVVLIEGGRIAGEATGRNGGFCSASLTHGEANGRERWPDEYELLHRLGIENLDEITATIERYGIDCDFRRTGELAVATRPHELAEYDSSAPDFLDAEALRREVDSPTYLGGAWDREGTAM